MLVVLVLASCSNYKEIKVEKVTNVSLREFSGSTAYINVTVLVNNPTSSKVNLNKVDIDVNRFENKFAHIESLEKVTIPARSHSEHDVMLKVRLTNILSSGFIFLTRKFKPEDYSITGFVKVSSFPFSKKVKFKDQRLSNLSKELDSVMKGSKRQEL